ncbi:MAG: endonuclease domain-containing protein [Acutalibacteraceae bacterium]
MQTAKASCQTHPSRLTPCPRREGEKVLSVFDIFSEKVTVLNYEYNAKNVPTAKKLRKNMTKEERHLWYDFLRNHPIHFYRQRTIGNYIVDFYSAQAKLAIEVDGGQHYEAERIEKDAYRTKQLEQIGIQVIRIPNNEVNNNFDGVCEFIENELNKRIVK